MSLNAFSNYKIKEPNSLPAHEDETLWTATELLNASSNNKALRFDLCTSKIPHTKKKSRFGTKEICPSLYSMPYKSLLQIANQCLNYSDSIVFKKEKT